MSNLLPDREPEPIPPGHEQWSPSMTWRGRAIAWVILAVIAIGLIAMLSAAFTGQP